MLWVLELGDRAGRLLSACDGDRTQAARVFRVTTAATVTERARRIAAARRETARPAGPVGHVPGPAAPELELRRGEAA